MRGRKHKQESRATEIREKLAEWKHTPEPSRPSLRTLARELSTSHQLLSFYLLRLDKWQTMEYHRRAEEIRMRAATENRDVTVLEECEVRALERAAFNCMLDSAIGKNLKQIEQDAKAGRLKRVHLRLLRLAAQHGYVKAHEILRSAAGAQK